MKDLPMLKMSFISVPALMIQSVPASALSAMIPSPKKSKIGCRIWGRASATSCWLVLVAIFVGLSMLRHIFTWHPGPYDDGCMSPVLARHQAFGSNFLASAYPRPLAPHAVDTNLTGIEREFWEQPDGMGYHPCIEFSEEYKQASRNFLSRRRRKYLMVVVSGGLNQQRNQIVDAVIMARILEATLVLPIMQVNVIWGDESEFSDIFDVDHFKKTLEDDVRVVSALPSTHVTSKIIEEKTTPLYATPEWLRSHYARRFRRDGILLLRGLDSRLSKDLPRDLQKLKCKVAFHALRFAAPIQAVGDMLAKRMWQQGPYLALHLRLEKDVWVRTGCLPGLGPKYDEEVNRTRARAPRLLTARSNMSYEERKLAGLCPLNAAEVVRLLKALGATKSTRIFWAGGQPLGGKQALEPLVQAFPHLYDKARLALPEELKPFGNKASSLAAIDYLVSLNSDVFMPSHGGNMGHAIQGHRAYAGHRKHITPNKREMLSYFLDASLPENAMDQVIRQVHNESLGHPTLRTDKRGRDVISYPVPECMCQRKMPTATETSTRSSTYVF